MKFFCEYCGNRIDAEKDHKCPNCGASYRKNKSFIKIQEEMKKEKALANENKQKILQHILGTFAFSKFFLLIPIIMFIIIVSIVVITIININKDMNEVDNNIDTSIKDFIDENINSSISGEQEVTVGFDEYGQTSEYKVKVTKYEVIEDTFNRLDDNYEYIKFHLMVENIAGERITKEDVYCIVDGVSQTNDFTSGYSDLPMFIAKDLTVTGTATFEIPKGSTTFDIRYGDYITIHIEK